MRRNFTLKNIIQHAMMTMALVAFAFSVQAQVVNTLRVNSPASIAGDYTFQLTTGFGQQLSSDLNGTGALLDDGTAPNHDGCEAGAGNVLGKIAFIDRGDCEFGTKALNAENAGAVAVIICNNQADPATVNMPEGADGPNVNVPSGMVSMADCNTIKVMLNMGDIDATLTYLCVPPIYGPEVVWGRNTGEGDFNGGIGDWTIEQPANLMVNTWHWDATGDATGLFTDFQIDSETLCNGAMVMSSDSLDNGGTAIGAGPCPNPCIASLVSPTIDLSSADPSKGFFIQFTQAFRQFTSEYKIIVSKNGGASYPDTLFLNTDAVVNSPNINESVKIPLIGYEGVQSLKFKFEYVGNYYYWIIDDVSITNESYVDMQANENWYAAPPHWKVPASQVSEMPFLIDIFNNGNLDGQNVEVTVDVYDDSGANIYNQVKNYGIVDAYTIDENNVFEDGAWTAPATPGVYTGYYVVSAESPDPAFPNNQLITNDSIAFQMEVTENLFTLAPGVADGATLRPFTDGSIFADNASGETISYAAGAVFYTPNGSGHRVGNITFGVTAEEQAQSGFVHARMYRWLGDLGGANEDNMMNPTERVLVGTNTIIVDTVANLGTIEIPIFAADGNGTAIPNTSVDLDDDAQYMLVLSTEPLTNQPGCCQIDLLSSQNTNGFDRNYNHFASNMAFDSTNVDRSPGSYFVGLTTGTPLDMDGAAIDFYDINELWTEIVVYDITSDTEDLNQSIGLAAYPNPAGNILNVNLALENTSDVAFEIIDLNGRLVQSDKFQNMKTGTVVLNISDVVTGTYVLSVKTDEGIRTEKIVIAK